MTNQTTITANQELVAEFIRRVFNEHIAEATPDYFSRDVQWPIPRSLCRRVFAERLLAQAEVPRRFGSFDGGAPSCSAQSIGICLRVMGREKAGHKLVAPQKQGTAAGTEQVSPIATSATGGPTASPSCRPRSACRAKHVS